jgi:hypothetical protein
VIEWAGKSGLDQAVLNGADRTASGAPTTLKKSRDSDNQSLPNGYDNDVIYAPFGLYVFFGTKRLKNGVSAAFHPNIET